MDVPTHEQVQSAYTVYQRLLSSARRGECSWCFSDQALRKAVALHNKRAAWKLSKAEEQMDKETIAQPYLVQRLRRRGTPNMTYAGIYRDFELEYMGSAEFEFGTANAQLTQMVLCCDELKIEEVKLPSNVTTNEGVVWYLGRIEQLPQAKAFVEDQLGPTPSVRFQERPEFRDVLIPGKWVPRATGWWAYSSYSRLQRPWVLFLTHADAVLFLDGVRRYVTKLAGS